MVRKNVSSKRSNLKLKEHFHMMANGDNKLDNPVWYSLSEVHQQFALNLGQAKFYRPEYCLFGESQQTNGPPDAIIQYAKQSSHFFVVGQKPELQEGFAIDHEASCLQMVINKRIDVNSNTIIEFTPDHLNDVLALVQIAYPHFFQQKTFFLGKNFGIFNKNQLVAITGERMKMDDFTEISSVIVHPEHTGKGYAHQLVAHTVNHILNEHKQPYLHVEKSNKAAIALYKKLGFKTRREITFWGVKTC